MNEYETLDRALDFLNYGIIKEEKVPKIDFNFLVQLEEAGLTIDDLIAMDEGISEVKQGIDNIVDLRRQWKRMADHFVMHKTITIYIKDDTQKSKIHDMFDKICNPDIKYGEYQRYYKFFCNLMGIPTKGTIIETLSFGKDKVDKDQDVVNIKYSKGLHVVNIPENMILYHSSPVKGLKELKPTFKSRHPDKYFYPTSRVYFTIQKDINPYKYGLGKGKFINTGSTTKMYKYTPKKKYLEAYIDPAFSLGGEISNRAVYIETTSPIPVVDITHDKADMFGNVKGIDKKLEG